MTEDQLEHECLAWLADGRRPMVERILRKYKYPPDSQDAAVELVLQQARAMREEWA